MKRELSLIQNGSEKEGQKSQRIFSHNPRSYFTPHSPYPVFLFLFKFFFKFPNFSLEALDVLGELGNGLGLLATTTAAPWRTSGPAVITGRVRIIKTNGLPENTAADLQTTLPGLPEKSRGQVVFWCICHGICSSMEASDHSTPLWANVTSDLNVQCQNISLGNALPKAWRRPI